MSFSLFTDTPAPARRNVLLPPPDGFQPDPQQKAVIAHRGTPLRVMSAAGSGKSTTTVYRVRSLVLEGVPSSSILVVTFTRKGAEALEKKFKEKCGDWARNVTTGTFHRIAAQEMIANSSRENRWHVLDEDDASDMWDQACREVSTEMLPSIFGCELFTGEKHLNLELERRIKTLFNPLREIRSFQVNMNRGGEPFGHFAAERLRPRSSAFRAVSQGKDLRRYFDEVLRRYQGLKELNAGKDYDDLLVEWRDMLALNHDYRRAIQERWQHVIVDEYQDTNYLQEDIIKNLNTANLVVVGDVGQCVYSWRSAVPALMINFRKRYPAADVPLEYNYRSKDEILKVANGVLSLHHALLTQSQGPDMDVPLLQLRGTRGPGGIVRWMPANDRNHETTLVSQRVEALLRGGEAPKNIAVLCRTSFYTGPLEARLRAFTYKDGTLPVQVWGGRSLLDSRTAKEILSLFKCIVRPADPGPFQRLATMVPGVGDVAAAQAFFRRMFCLPCPIALQGLNGILHDLSDIFRREGQSAEDKLLQIIDESCNYLVNVYRADKKADAAEIRQRENEIRALEEGMKGAIQDMRDRNGAAPLDINDLINTYSLDPKRDRNDPEALTISTVHQAKGLEWKHVFVVGVSEGVLPILRKRDSDEPPTKAEIAAAQAEIEEECRILYVALTRAMDTLTISYARDGSGMSRFLRDVPSLRKECEAAESLLGFAPVSDFRSFRSRR